MAYILVCRDGDETYGRCSAHKGNPYKSGTITSMSSDVFNGELGIARDGDVITASCGHHGHIVSTGSTVFCNDTCLARVGDSFVGTYDGTITGGSSDLYSED